MKMRVRKLLYIFFAVVIAVSSYFIWREVNSLKTEQESFEELSQIIVPVETKTEEPKEIKEEITIKVEKTEKNIDKALPKEETVIQETSEPKMIPERNIKLLREMNGDCMGWICIPGTKLDYPVMHTPTDPEMYLRRDFYGEYSHSGTPFMDSRCAYNSDNVLIYGHNMKNNTMFSLVDNYAEQSYRDAHPTIEFETAEGCKLYTVFAAAVVEADDAWYQFVDAETQAEFDENIAYIKSISIYDTEITPQYGKQIVTLSTCDYTQENARFIITAIEN